jgi:hypothetical protein
MIRGLFLLPAGSGVGVEVGLRVAVGRGVLVGVVVLVSWQDTSKKDNNARINGISQVNLNETPLGGGCMQSPLFDRLTNLEISAK